MALQFSVGARNSRLEAIELAANGQTLNAGVVTGSATQPTLEIRTGAPPANAAAADTGSVLATITLPANSFADAASGAKALTGTWQATATGTGTGGHFRIKNGATTHLQGTCGSAVPLTTNALTAANSNVLNFASTTGVAAGQIVSGTGVVAGSIVVATTATTVTMDRVSTAGVANGAAITFSGDMTLDNTSINTGQQVTVTAFNLTEGNA
jgi:hypothetical protein